MNGFARTAHWSVAMILSASLGVVESTYAQPPASPPAQPAHPGGGRAPTVQEFVGVWIAKPDKDTPAAAPGDKPESLMLRLMGDGNAQVYVFGLGIDAAWDERDADVRVRSINGGVAYTIQVVDGGLRLRDGRGRSMTLSRLVADRPMNERQVIGQWTGKRSDGVTITMTIQPNGKGVMHPQARSGKSFGEANAIAWTLEDGLLEAKVPYEGGGMPLGGGPGVMSMPFVAAGDELVMDDGSPGRLVLARPAAPVPVPEVKPANPKPLRHHPKPDDTPLNDFEKQLVGRWKIDAMETVRRADEAAKQDEGSAYAAKQVRSALLRMRCLLMEFKADHTGRQDDVEFDWAAANGAITSRFMSWHEGKPASVQDGVLFFEANRREMLAGRVYVRDDIGPSPSAQDLSGRWDTDTEALRSEIEGAIVLARDAQLESIEQSVLKWMLADPPKVTVRFEGDRVHITPGPGPRTKSFGYSLHGDLVIPEIDTISRREFGQPVLRWIDGHLELLAPEMTRLPMRLKKRVE